MIALGFLLLFRQAPHPLTQEHIQSQRSQTDEDSCQRARCLQLQLGRMIQYPFGEATFTPVRLGLHTNPPPIHYYIASSAQCYSPLYTLLYIGIPIAQPLTAPYRVKKHPKHTHQPPNIALTSLSKTDRGYKTASSPP